MILNDQQYQLTRAWLARFRQELTELPEKTLDDAPLLEPLFESRKGALESQIQQLQQQLDDYDELRSSQATFIQTSSLSE